MVGQPWLPRVGDRVLVPWGLDDVEGEVVEVYPTGLGPRARVQLSKDLEGGTVTVPLDSLSPAGAQGTRTPSTGTGNERRVGGLDYERRVGAALRQAATELNLRAEKVSPHAGADFQFALGRRQLIVRVKQYPEAGRVSTDTLLTAAGMADERTAVLLVANVPLASTAKQRLEQMRRSQSRIWFVHWRSSADDSALRAAFTRLLLNWRAAPPG